MREHLSGLLYSYPTLRTILRPSDVDIDAFSHVESLLEIYVPPSRASTLARLSSLEQELSLRSDQVAALVQSFDSPAAVIRRLAESARLEADASKSASSGPSAPDSDGLTGDSVAPGHSSAIRALSSAQFTRAHAAIAPLLASVPIDPFAVLATAFRSGSLLLLQTLFSVQNRVSFHPLLRTLASMRVHLPSYAGQLLVLQTDGSPPASDRLKSFALDKNELAKLLSLKLADLDLINFGIFATEASRRGKLMVMTTFKRCSKAGQYLLELAESGHRLTVGFG